MPGLLLKNSDVEIKYTQIFVNNEWHQAINGETLPSESGTFTYTRHEPIGICGQIIPW
jgi:aldehyde dehydrogenase (NAD+)